MVVVVVSEKMRSGDRFHPISVKLWMREWQMWDATYNEGHMMTTSISNFLIMFTEFVNIIETQSTIMHAQVPPHKTRVSLGTTT